MKQLLLVLLLFAAAGASLAAVPDERCAARADINGIPVVTLGAKVPSDRFAVMITGDGGWRRIDQKITDRLRAAGVPIALSTDDEGVSRGAGRFQEFDVSGMQKVETSVCENHAAPVAFTRAKLQNEFFES